jgi:hypothetical protein
MSHLIRTPIYWVIMILTVSLSALTFPLQARVQLDLVAKFQNVDIELYVVTVVDSEVEAESKVALLGIATPLRSSCRDAADIERRDGVRSTDCRSEKSRCLQARVLLCCQHCFECLLTIGT